MRSRVRLVFEGFKTEIAEVEHYDELGTLVVTQFCTVQSLDYVNRWWKSVNSERWRRVQLKEAG